uniref:Piezo-type mechanosensitive ion channel component n=1 Tax=Cryptocotyle lingua TaxID=66766 RepID=A0A7U0YF06_9TREM|nr:piezo-type mechanosensitive ion channel component [Cryptocotyle lingua]
MASFDTILLRVVLAAALLSVTVVRYNGFSFVYLLFLLACPLLPRPSSSRSKTKVQVFLILLVTLSCIFTLSHPALHIILAVAPPYDNALKTCEESTIAAQIGVQRLNGVVAYRAMRLVLPDIFILTFAVGLLVYISRRGHRTSLSQHSATRASNVGGQSDQSAPQTRRQTTQPTLPVNNSSSVNPLFGKFTTSITGLPFPREWDAERRKLWRAWAVDNLCVLLSVVLVCVAGITSPSILSSIYLLSFLGIGTYWACRSGMNPVPFSCMRIFLLVYSGLHVCLYYLYQFPFFQSICPDGGFIARLLGLYYIMQTSCDKPGEILFPPDVRLVDLIAPPLTILLYYVLAFETWRWFESSSKRSRLLRNVNNATTRGRTSPINEEEALIPLAHTSSAPVDEALASSESTNTVKINSRTSAVSLANETEQVSSGISNTAVPSAPPAPYPTHTEVNSPVGVVDGTSDDIALLDFRPTQCETLPVPETPATATKPGRDFSARKQPRPHSKLTDRVTDRIQPHLDVIFSLTPPFVLNPFGAGAELTNNNVRTERPLLLSLHFSAIRHSYIVTLIAMMAWAVTYRSWLSFILLLSACIMWISPNSRGACLYASPLIVLYGIVLILIQYVYGLNLRTTELPAQVTKDGLEYSELGMKKWDNSVGALAVQISFLVFFWLTLRLFVNERSYRRFTVPTPIGQEPSVARGTSIWDRYMAASVGSWFGSTFAFGTVDNTAYRKFTEVFRALCVDYWIGVCCLSMLLISIQQPVVIFRIFYMVLLIYFMFTFQISYSFWRRQMLVFWWINVVYSIAILLCIYTFQFKNSPDFWQRTTGLSEDVLKDIGLETFDNAALFGRLLTPVVFLVVIILQVHYFHEPFLKRSALDRFSRLQELRDLASATPQPSSDPAATLSHSTTSSFSKLLRTLAKRPRHYMQRQTLYFIEDVNSAFHTIVTKLTAWAISLTNCCWRFLEVHWIKLIALLIFLNSVKEVCAPNLISIVLLVICFPFPYLHGFFATVIFVWTGLLTLCKMCFQLSFVQLNVTIVCDSNSNLTTHMTDASWVGLIKVPNFYQYIQPMSVLLAICVCWHTISYRQQQFYNHPHHKRPREGIVFPAVSISSLDEDLRNVVKFAINYAFYKFGLEICYCVTVVTACLRADAFSVLYLVLLLIFLFTPRHVCAKLWLPYLIILAVLIPIQYAGCVGLPPGLCWEYPWLTESKDFNNLLQWLFVPGSYGSPTAKKLTADFFQFIAVALQYQVFQIERSPDAKEYGGGSNKPVLIDNVPGKDERDFVSSKESYLDYMRHLIFYWSYWVSLAIVLATGVTWITLFCLGYMILSFIYLWMGQNVMLRKRISLIKSWNVIIGYNFCVILAKCSLQVIGCVYWTSMSNQCWFIQLFGVQCMDPMSWSRFASPVYDEQCKTVSSGLHWDVICFIFILFQRKIFMTQSFSHVVFDLNVQSQFASRGAYLINRKLMTDISEQRAREELSLAKIQEKLAVIQRRQAILGRNTDNITEHYIMLRSGDYYLFEGDPEEDDEQPPPVPPKGGKKKKPPPKQLGSSTSKLPLYSTNPSQSGPTGHGASTFHGIPEVPMSPAHSDGTVMESLSFSGMHPLGPHQQQLSEVLPDVEPSAMEVLTNFTDPYGATSPTNRNFLNHNMTLSNRQGFGTSYAAGRALGHRRLRSHPEYMRQQFGTPVSDARLPPSVHLETPATQFLRTVHTSPMQLLEQTRDGTPNKRVETTARRTPKISVESSVRRKPHQTHRRIVSASAALTPSTSRTSSSAHTEDLFSPTRAGRRLADLPSKPPSQVPPHTRLPGPLSFESGLKLRSGTSKADRRSSLQPGNGHGTYDSSGRLESAPTLLGPGHARFDDRTLMQASTVEAEPNDSDFKTQRHSRDGADDRAEDADWDSCEGEDEEEEDDVNPGVSSGSRLNPLQLLNQAMEHGACLAVRQYRQSFFNQSRVPRTRELADDSSSSDVPSTLGADETYLRTGQSGLPSTTPSRPSSLQYFTQSGYPELPRSQDRRLRSHRSGPVNPVGGEPQTKGAPSNQSNRGWLSRRLKKHSRLSSLASVENEDESIFNLGTSLASSSEDVTVKRSLITKPHKAEQRIGSSSAEPTSPRREKPIKMVKTRLAVGSPKSLQFSETQQSLTATPDSAISVKFGRVRRNQQKRAARKPVSFGSKQSSKSLDPSESEDELGLDSSTLTAHQREEGCWSKFKASCLIVYLFFLSSIDSLIYFLNDLTKQYRNIRRRIEREKRSVKLNVINSAQQPEQSPLEIEVAVFNVVSKSPEHVPGNLPIADLYDRRLATLGPAHSFEHVDVLDRHQQREKAFRQSRSRPFLLLVALGNLAIVYSEWFCYLLLVVNHMRSSNFLSLVYPLVVFLWGMLSVPRPTKTFWIFLITYTEVVIVIKYIFQFKFITFNDPWIRLADSSEATWLPRLFGVEKNNDYAILDLVQLITLFLHRGFLKNDGLWRDHTEFAQDLELAAERNKLAERVQNGEKVDPALLRLLSNEADPDQTVESHNIVPATPGRIPPNLHRRSWNPFAKLRRFYHKMTDPQFNKKVDVYVYMFLCEFISFWIMIFGYVSFGPSTGMGDNAITFIRSNRVPLPFISMVLAQFIFIIIDRGLFLRKQVLGKFIFQILHVMLIHGWLFFILPYITKTPFTRGIAPQLLYLIKCIYFSLSAYQIRSGYPLRILGNFLTKNYNYINLILFKGYLIVPFLYELRNVMDWMWTNSALSLYHWMELEDVYAKIFVHKCWRRSEVAYPTQRGVSRPAGKKAVVGGLLLSFFFICFWGPLLFSSFIDVTFNSNPPVFCTFGLSIGGFPPIFEFTSREGNILEVEQEQLKKFTRCHDKDLQTVGFLHNFEVKDLRYIKIDGFSGNIWAITPPSYNTLMNKLADPKSDLRIHTSIVCNRKPQEFQTYQISVKSVFSRELQASEKLNLYKVLNGTTLNVRGPRVKLPPRIQGSSPVTLNAVMPRYLVLTKDRLREGYAKLGLNDTFVNVSFVIHRDLANKQAWWELKERIDISFDPCFELFRAPMLGDSSGDVVSILTFNDRVSDNILGKMFSTYGIIGMYAAYIFFANRLLRTIYTNISYVIRLEELPHVDRILNLCNEIYLVRENKLLRLEEQLVAKLFFLYRSSETMIKWTRHPKRLIEKFTAHTGGGHQSPPSQPSLPDPRSPPTVDLRGRTDPMHYHTRNAFPTQQAGTLDGVRWTAQDEQDGVIRFRNRTAENSRRY